MQWRKNIRDKTKKERVPIATLATPVVSQSGWFMFVWQEWIIIKMSRELTSMVAVPGKNIYFPVLNLLTRLADREKLISLQEKYLNILEDLIIAAVGT